MRALLLASSALLGLALPIVAFPGSAAAQTSTSSTVDAVTVTGRSFVIDQAWGAAKTDLPIVETPQAISVVGHDFIDTLNLRTLAEALNYTSGVRSQSAGSDTRIEYYQIRGFSSQNLFKDGLVLFNSGAFLAWTTPAEGVERLEVLKGPASVLYGSGSAGGMVNIISKAPLRRPFASIEAGFDEYGSVYASADASGPVSDTFAVRAVGLLRRGDTQVKLAEDNRSYAALSAAWTPTADTTLTLRGSYTGDRSNRPTGFVPYTGFVTPLADGRRIPIDLYISDPSVDRYDRDQYEVGYSLDTRFASNLHFTSNGRFGRIDLTYAGLSGAFTGNPVLSGGRYRLNRGAARQESWLDNITVDNHLDGAFKTGPLTHRLLAGLEYSGSKTASAVAQGTAPALDIFAPQYNVAIPALPAATTTRQKLDQAGVYVQDEIKWGGLTALLSTRRDRLDITSTNAAGAVTRTKPDKQTYRVGVSYMTAIGIAPFASYATSFTPVIGIEPATGRYYRPETGESWEAGVKYQSKSRPLLLTASLFTIDRDGVLVSNPVPGFVVNQSQLGQVRSRGGEIEVQARPLPTLNITAALTAFDIENREGLANTIGKTPTATPEFTASAFADYTLPESAPLAGLGFGAGVRRVGKSYADAINTLVVPGATVFDAALHYEWSHYRAALNVSNLFDKAYVGACPAAGTCYAANLRRATFSLGYRW